MRIRQRKPPIKPPPKAPDRDLLFLTRGHALFLLLLPWLIYLVNPNWPFQSLGHMDAWYYFGYFIHFPKYQIPLPNYAGERLTWILPGLLLSRLLTAPYGTLALHLICYYVAVFSVYFVAARISNRRTALLTSSLLGCHPLFLGANGWTYYDGAAIAFLSLTLALLAKSVDSGRERWFLVLAGMAWGALVYTFAGWALLSPVVVLMYIGLVARNTRELSPRRLADPLFRFAGFMAAGLALTTIGRMVCHRLIYGNPEHFFFYHNVRAALGIGRLADNPWSSGNYKWILSASWLVFPMLALVAGAGTLLRHKRLPEPRRMRAAAVIIAYVYAALVMAAMTVHEFRMLENDFFASILLPLVFLVLAVTVLEVPDSVSGLRFESVVVLSCLVCVLPLAGPGLHRVMLFAGLAAPRLIGAAGVLKSLRAPRTAAGWSFAVLCLSAASFGLVPGHPDMAWTVRYDGLAATKRVAAAVQAIDRRFSAGEYPAFWIDNQHSILTSEYRSIMCAFTAHELSMKRYPEVDGSYSPGRRLVLVTETRDVFESANRRMSAAGMPLALLSQERITGDGVSYWLTFVRVLRPQTS